VVVNKVFPIYYIALVIKKGLPLAEQLYKGPGSPLMV
jgi:hypothetical protein